MGYVPQQVVYNVDFSGTKLVGLEIKVQSISTDQILHLTRLAETFDVSASGARQGDAVDTLLTELAGMIVSWNVETPDGTPVPPSRQALGQQDLGRFVLPVLRMCIDAIVGVDDELGKGSASGPPSPAVSLPMETLSANPPS